MKYFYTLAILFLFTPSFGQNDLILPSSNGMWRNTWQTPGGLFPQSGNYFYTLGDSVNVNDTTYRKVMKSSRCESSSYAAYYFRENQGKYYFRQPFENYELLLYDFACEVGDTIQVSDFYLGGYMPNLVVEDIEPIMLLDGSERRRWKLRYLSISAAEHEYWIEGIGNLDGGLIRSLANSYFDSGETLVCYSENGLSLYAAYQALIGNCCYVGIEEIKKATLTIFPNPVEQELNITCSDVISQLTLLDINGQIMVVTEPFALQIRLDLRSLAAGCYAIYALTENGHLMTEKFIKD